MIAEPDPVGDLHRGLLVVARSTRLHEDATYGGLSFTTFTLLSYVASAEAPHAADLAALHGLDKSTVSRQLTEFLADGLLQRAPDPVRARTQLLALTGKGRRQLQTARARQRKALEARMQTWPAEDVATLGRLLLRFALETAEQPALAAAPAQARRSPRGK